MITSLIRTRTIRLSLLAALSATGLAAAVAATAPPPPPPPGEQPAGHDGMGAGMRGPGMGREGMRGGRMDRMQMGRMGMMDPFMRALHELDLTAEQRDKVHGIMEAAHKSHEGEMRAMGENLTVVGNPGDVGYAAAVQAAKDKAAAMIQHHSDLDREVYAVLTSEQKARLPKVLADMKAKLDERKQHWEQREHDHKADAGKPGH